MTDIFNCHQIRSRLGLARQEWVILTLVLQHRFVRRETIIDLLWPNPDLYPKYIDNSLGIIMHKLRKKSKIGIHTTYREGYFIESPRRERLLAGFLEEARTGVTFNQESLNG